MNKKILALLMAVMVSVAFTPASVFATGNTGGDSENEIQSAEELLSVHNNKGRSISIEKVNENKYDGFIFTLNKDTTKSEKKALDKTIKNECDEEQAEKIFGDNMYYADSLDTIEEIADLDTIKYIEPNYILHTMVVSEKTGKINNNSVKSKAKMAGEAKADGYTPNDTYFSTNKWAYDQMNIEGVWEKGVFGKGQKGMETPTVAVIDTGIAGWGQKSKYKHPDLNYNNMPNVVKGSGIYHYYDDNGHGTFVTGEIAAIMNNGTGTNGLMPDVKIVPCKVLNSKGSVSTSNLISHLNYLYNNNSKLGIDVINMSLGGPSPTTSFQTAINKIADLGIIIVASAGNDGNTTYNYPASYDNVISVSATDKDGDRASYSQYNDTVDIAAPGGDSDGYIYGTYPSYCGYTYVGMMGTSMAAPYVSAMAAMVKSLDSSMNHNKFMTLIQSTSTDKGPIGYDTTYGYGIVNFSAAYAAITGDNPGETTKKVGSAVIKSGILSYEYDDGNEIKPEVTVKDTEGNVLTENTHYTLEYSNNKEVGTATITVTGINDYAGSSTTVTFEITAVVKALGSIVITSGQSSYVHTGSQIKPPVTVKDTKGNVLTENTHYTLAYSDNVSVGTARITATGANGYTGSVSVTFQIKNATKEIGTVSVDKSSYEYTGSDIKPAVTVKDKDGNKLDSGCYKVTYSSNRSVGKATVKAEGVESKGYKGSATCTFTIVPKGTSLLTVIASKKAFNVTWTRNTTQTTGYILQYSTSSDFTTGTSSITISRNKTYNQSVKNLQSKKTYYVRIQTYKDSGSDTYKSSWSAVKKVTTR